MAGIQIKDRIHQCADLHSCFEFLERIFASPIAKKIANEKSINLGDLSGSGPNGRILKADVESYTPAGMSFLIDFISQEQKMKKRSWKDALVQEISSLTQNTQHT
jgi:pyruvate dehydrogenase E2 component (dihydrolipoamide acetyltransferase)